MMLSAWIRLKRSDGGRSPKDFKAAQVKVGASDIEPPWAAADSQIEIRWERAWRILDCSGRVSELNEGKLSW